MPLPRIPYGSTIAAIPEMSDGFIAFMEIRTDSTNPLQQRATIEAIPYDQNTGTLFPYPGVFTRHEIPDLWEEAARSTLFAQAMYYVTLYMSLAMQEKIALAANDNDALDEIWAAMGVSQ